MTPTRHPRVREIDFRRPSKFNREQVRRIEVAHENFCQSASSRMSAELRTELQLGVLNTDQLPYGVVMAEEVKDGLKWVFGRPWPETWRKNDNSSFIRNHDYAFHWFRGGSGFNSFPSGHMTATLAVLSVLWLCYPRFRPLYALVALAVMVGLVGSNFHFLGDTIAGAFLGVTVGWMTLALYDRAPRHPLTAE